MDRETEAGSWHEAAMEWCRDGHMGRHFYFSGGQMEYVTRTRRASRATVELLAVIISRHAQGVSMRKLARETGRSRDFIRAVIAGEYAGKAAIPEWRKHAPHPFSIGPYERCIVCGALVVMPCYACYVRESNHVPQSIEIQE